jgi:hypothetical protein
MGWLTSCITSCITSCWRQLHKRSSKEQEHLTGYEERVIGKKKRCPDCGGRLLGGPQGGLAVNVCCMQCHSEFNVTIVGNAVIGQRISDRGPREIGDRAWCYGLEEGNGQA